MGHLGKGAPRAAAINLHQDQINSTIPYVSPIGLETMEDKWPEIGYAKREHGMKAGCTILITTVAISAVAVSEDHQCAAGIGRCDISTP